MSPIIMLLRLIMIGRSTPQRRGDEVRARIKKNRKTALSSNLPLHPTLYAQASVLRVESTRDSTLAGQFVLNIVETIRPKRIVMKMPPMAYEKHGASISIHRLCETSNQVSF